MRPTRPETGFGYLELGCEVPAIAGQTVRRVVRFIEKPDRERAEAFAASGNHLWNAGMFVWTVAAIERAVRTHLPELAAGLDEMAAAADDEAGRLFAELPRVSIDFGVMEKAKAVLALPVDFAWSDVGSWPGLAEVLGADSGVRIHKPNLINPIDGKCCYRDARWSPDGSYLIFAFQDLTLGGAAPTVMYYVPAGQLGTGTPLQPLLLDPGFFKNPKEGPQPALRPAEYDIPGGALLHQDFFNQTGPLIDQACI